MDSRQFLEVLLQAGWDGALRFTARRRFIDSLASWYEASGGIPSLLGARIHPVPHQLYAARRVLADEWPRHLLADEVGLGKTIEAGLVVQALRNYHGEIRILIVAPGAMGRQWLCELFVRFGEQVFMLLDAGRLARDEAGPLLDHGRVIVSFTALQVYSQLKEQILKRDWDLIIIDEAHQIHPGSDIYAFLQELSAASKGLLALSATPSKRSLTGLGGLLSLVDPINAQQYDQSVLNERFELGQGLQKIVCNRRKSVALQGTELCRRRLKAIRYNVPDVERDAIAHIEAHPPPIGDLQTALTALYRLKASSSPMVVLELFEKRQRIIRGESTIASDDQKKEFARSLHADPGPDEEDHLWQHIVTSAPPLLGEEEWLDIASEKVRAWMETTVDGSARYRAVSGWIQSALQRDPSAKVLVFAGDWRLVEDFEVHLSDRLGQHRVACIHYRMDEVSLASQASKFQRDKSCSVLISDELGGEGRNFQFASAVVHLDVPWSPTRLEQRIGRLDRMGRNPSRTVLSVVPLGSSRTEAAIQELQSTALNVFESSLGGLEFMLAAINAEICSAVLAGPSQVEKLTQKVAVKVSDERAKNHELIADSPETDLLQECTRQVKAMAATDHTQNEQAIASWIQLLGGRYELDSDGRVTLGWDESKLRRPLEGIPGRRVRRIGTFDRQQALRDESLEFFAPGHPIVDALIRDLLTSSDGRVCALCRDLGHRNAGILFLVVTWWDGDSPNRPSAPHELSTNSRGQGCIQHCVVRIGSEPLEIEEHELKARIVAPVGISDSDLPQDFITISKSQLVTAFQVATQELNPDEIDSVALVFGSDE